MLLMTFQFLNCDQEQFILLDQNTINKVTPLVLVEQRVSGLIPSGNLRCMTFAWFLSPLNRDKISPEAEQQNTFKN